MSKSGMVRKIGFTAIGFVVVAIALAPGDVARGDDLQDAIRLIVAQNTAAAKAQSRIERIDDDTDKLVTQYREIQRQIESLKVYEEQIQKLVVVQRKQMEDLQKQINDAAMVGRGITPLMFRMLDSLEEFVKLDVPFLLEERTKRLADLRNMMNQSDISDSDKYRRILEAYQIENEYGRTIEAYGARLKIGSEERTVDFLKIGRIVLVYKSIDGNIMGIWDKEAGQWKDLSKEYENSVQLGFRMARKQAAPDLVRLPVPAAKDVR
jgi:hypothetical protein